MLRTCIISWKERSAFSTAIKQSAMHVHAVALEQGADLGVGRPLQLVHLIDGAMQSFQEAPLTGSRGLRCGIGAGGRRRNV